MADSTVSFEHQCDRCSAVPTTLQTFCAQCGPVRLCGDCTTLHLVEVEEEIKDGIQHSKSPVEPKRILIECLLPTCDWQAVIPVENEEVQPILEIIAKAEALKHAAAVHSTLFQQIVGRDPQVALQEYDAELRSMGVEIEGHNN